MTFSAEKFDLYMSINYCIHVLWQKDYRALL